MPTNYPALRRAWWAVYVLALAGVFSYTDRQILSLLVDPIRQDLRLTDGDLGILQGAVFAIVYALAALPIGAMVDRYSRRNIIAGGILLWSVATMACAFAESFSELALARMAVAIGEAALGPAAVSMIGDLFSAGRRGVALSTLVSGFTIGGGVAILLGGAILGAADSGYFVHIPLLGMLPPWKEVLIVASLPGFVFALLALTIAEPQRHLADGGAVKVAPLRTILEARRLRSLVVPIYLGLAGLGIGDFAVGAWVPTLLGRRFLYLPTDIATRFGFISIAAALGGTVLGGFLADRAHRRGGPPNRLKTATHAALVALVAGALSAVAHAASTELACVAVWIAASSAASIGGIAALQDILPSQLRGLGMAVYAFCYIMLGMSLGPSVVAFGAEHVFTGAAALTLSIAAANSLAGALAITGLWMGYGAVRRGTP